MLDATPLFRHYARRRLRQLNRHEPAEIQARCLLGLVRTAASTRFGQDHAFSRVHSIEAFQQAVPLRRYDDFWTTYWEPAFPRLNGVTWPGVIPYFAVTSGTTTGTTKYIPVSKPMIDSNRKAGTDLFVHHVAFRPRSRVMGGRSLMLGGSTDLKELAPGIWSGDLSGIIAKTMPWWARLRYFPPREVETISDWERKIAVLAERSTDQDIRAISGVPSWMLIYLDQLVALSPARGRSLQAHFPNLEMIIHGGVSFAPYREMFRDRLADSGAETREVYATSEGFIGVADRADGEGLRLMLDSGLFYEFVPLEELGSSDPTRHWVATVEADVNYAIVLSSCAGAWAYIVGDTVRFVNLEPPRVLVTGRTSYSLSAFGEHLIAEEIENAVATAAAAIEYSVIDFSVGPVFPAEDGEVGGHLYIVEFERGIPSERAIANFGSVIDENLSATNEDYCAHRSGGYGMRAPHVRPVPAGTFATWMKSRGQLGGQHKVPRIINDLELFGGLCRFIDKM